jgi:GT2 family glycosyltransferase
VLIEQGPTDADGRHAGPERSGPPILAVVPTIDVDSRRLWRLLESISDVDGSAQVELLVVVNTTTGHRVDLSLARSHPLAARTTFVETGLNLGFAGSVRFAATLIDFSHIWLLQDDLVVHPSCLIALLAALDRQPALGAANPTVVTGRDIVRRHQAGGTIDAGGHVSALFPARDVPWERYRPRPDLDFIMSRGMLIRAEAWHAVGGTDERFYPVGFSDVDLSTRLRARGWGVCTEAEAKVLHTKGASTPRALNIVTLRRNSALYRAKIAGETDHPPVHPDIPREMLDSIAQSASSLAFDLSQRITIRFALLVALVRLRARLRQVFRRAMGA